MTLFQNGRLYPTCVSLAPPCGQILPFIEVDMLGPSGTRAHVIGKVDTGAFMTLLTFATARLLGLAKPARNPIKEDAAHAANGQAFSYYVHSVTIRIPDPGGWHLLFPLEAGFAQELKRNLFGIDWLDHVCLVVDRRQVHLLRD